MKKIIINTIFIICCSLCVFPDIKAQHQENKAEKDSIKDVYLLMSGRGSLSDSYKLSLPVVIPPTPQSQIYEKYVDHPVTEYNGLVDITVPLYELELDGMKIPVVLNYHSSGIKYDYAGQYAGTPNQTPNANDGDAGAGWSLSIGGYRISRTINGAPDEKYPFYDENEAEQYLNSMTVAEKDSYLASIYYANRAGSSPVKNTKQPYKDAEFDIFTYMMPSCNGHFILDKNRSPINVEGGSERIQTDSNLDNLIITDGNGFKYYMGKYIDNNLLAEVRVIDSKNEKVGWPLKRITSPHNRTIDFKYEEFSYDLIKYSSLPIVEPYYLDEATSVMDFSSELPNYNELIDVDFTTMNSDSYMFPYKELLISEIVAEDVSLTIKRRKNEKPNNLIESIEIKRNNKFVRKIVFNYNIPTGIDWHCLLKNITIEDGFGGKFQKYSFDYYDPPIEGFRSLFPDQWGYYSKGKPYLQTSEDRKDLFLHAEFLNMMVKERRSNHVGTTSLLGESFIADYVKTFIFDRSNDNLNPHYFSLRRITYPTGGTTEFIYESNEYLDDTGQRKIGGGQRIKKIVSNANDNNSPVTTIYKYGESENGIGMANIAIKSLYFYDKTAHVSVTSSPSGGHFLLYGKISSMLHLCRNPIVPEISDFEVNYACVTCYKTNANNLAQFSKMVSTYEIPQRYKLKTAALMNTGDMIYSGAWPYYYQAWSLVEEYNLGKKTKITSRTIFNSNSKLIQSETYKYRDTSNNTVMKGLKVKQNVTFDRDMYQAPWAAPYTTGGLYYVYSWINHILSCHEYKLKIGSELLSEKKVITYDFDGNNPVETLERYNYDNKNRQTIYSVDNSINGLLMTEYIYPQNEAELLNKNIIIDPIEIKTFNNNKLIGKIKTIYSNNSILPISKESYIGNNINGVITYDRYDNRFGNLLQYTLNDAIVTTYLWSYNGKYPIAEIKNAKYQDVCKEMGGGNESLGNLFLENLAIKVQPSDSDIDLLKGLQTSLKDAMITIYIYKPLFGIESMIDPRGIRTYYEYDNLGYLKEIRDSNNKILEYYDRKYKMN